MEKQTQIKLELGGREIILVGTAHVSKESIEEVERAIEEQNPDTVAVELDELRLGKMENPDEWKDMDIIRILRKKQGFLLLANIILASYQKKMGVDTGVTPGQEMVAAINKAKSLGLPQVMVDRPISVTLRRAWAKNSPAGKMKLLSILFSSAFVKENVPADEIENLKKTSEMDQMMGDLAEYLPVVKEVLIDERDRYLATKIWACEGNRILVVLGAGHLMGVKECLENIAAEKESYDVASLESVPSSSVKSRIVAWTIPAVIIAMIAVAFYFGGKEKGAQVLSSWGLWNGILAGIGALAGGAHIVTILVSMIGAPLTSLCPLVGIGFLAAFVQALIKKPKVEDMEKLQNDSASVKGFYRNRILRILLIFFFSSIGSSIGTFAGGASIIAIISNLMGEIARSLGL